MPSTGIKKLEQMRAYAKTPAGRAAQKRSRDTFVIKRRTASKALKIKPQALLKALALWR